MICQHLNEFCDGDRDGDEKILILTGMGMGWKYILQGRLGTDLNFTGMDGDGDKCRALMLKSSNLANNLISVM